MNAVLFTVLMSHTHGSLPVTCFLHLTFSAHAFDHTLIALMSFWTGYSFANDTALQFVERMQVLLVSI